MSTTSTTCNNMVNRSKASSTMSTTATTNSLHKINGRTYSNSSGDWRVASGVGASFRWKRVASQTIIDRLDRTVVVRPAA